MQSRHYGRSRWQLPGRMSHPASSNAHRHHKSTTTPLSSNPVTKCYYTNGARYDEDISQNTNDKGQVIWATS